MNDAKTPRGRRAARFARCSMGKPLAPAVFCLAVAISAPLTAKAEMPEDVTPEQLYRQFRQEHPQDVAVCFPALDLAGGPGSLSAEGEPDVPGWRRAMIALDASGSMAGQAGGESKMQAAVSAVARFAETLPEELEAGLVVFGHEGTNDDSGKAASCAGVTIAVPAAAGSAAAIRDALSGVQPTGWTPLARAIGTAGAALETEAEAGEQVLFVVSDGKETCEGDPVSAARALNDSGARVVVNVIGFDLPAEDREKLAEVAEVGGGTYMDAGNGDEILRAMQRQAVWRQARFDHEVGARRVMWQNSTDSFVLKSEAGSCVADIRNTEHKAISERIKELRRDDRIAGEVLMAFREMVIADHDEHRKMLEAYRAALDAQTESANEAIDGDIVAPGTPAP